MTGPNLELTRTMTLNAPVVVYLCGSHPWMEYVPSVFLTPTQAPAPEPSPQSIAALRSSQQDRSVTLATEVSIGNCVPCCWLNVTPVPASKGLTTAVECATPTERVRSPNPENVTS
jgi:hypothetical protein